MYAQVGALPQLSFLCLTVEALAANETHQPKLAAEELERHEMNEFAVNVFLRVSFFSFTIFLQFLL